MHERTGYPQFADDAFDMNPALIDRVNAIRSTADSPISHAKLAEAHGELEFQNAAPMQLLEIAEAAGAVVTPN